ncbi:hypothetical protein CMV30_14080 [Nibricoccus aquaticus]|uniref:Uncharacterized protein n=1 Tax=Nibricoccus aquaticus TaxID=2576891 RepID=A0A290QKW0_9BACT|nr:hypothetical protein CMV30_14080 [Nibricoccus aquaticus]
MPSPRVESSPGSFRRSRAVRWLLSAALLALTPKCVVCVAAYLGAGAALGLGGPQWCGPATGASPAVSWMTALAWIGATGLAGALGVCASCRTKRQNAKL